MTIPREPGSARMIMVTRAKMEPMNGADHYKLAENLIADWERNRDPQSDQRYSAALAAAQAHATLAMAAATAMGGEGQLAAAWRNAAGIMTSA